MHHARAARCTAAGAGPAAPPSRPPCPRPLAPPSAANTCVVPTTAQVGYDISIMTCSGTTTGAIRCEQQPSCATGFTGSPADSDHACSSNMSGSNGLLDAPACPGHLRPLPNRSHATYSGVRRWPSFLAFMFTSLAGRAGSPANSPSASAASPSPYPCILAPFPLLSLVIPLPLAVAAVVGGAVVNPGEGSVPAGMSCNSNSCPPAATSDCCCSYCNNACTQFASASDTAVECRGCSTPAQGGTARCYPGANGYDGASMIASRTIANHPLPRAHAAATASAAPLGGAHRACMRDVLPHQAVSPSSAPTAKQYPRPAMAAAFQPRTPHRT